MFNKPKKLPVKEYKDGQTQRLKKRIARLEKEKNELKSQIRAYESAFRDVTKFLRDSTKDISLEDLISAAQRDKSLEEVKQDTIEVCRKCLSEDVKITKVPFGRIVICNDCNHREVIKNVNESVQQDSENENTEDN